MGEVKMMLSHDKQHFVNTSEKNEHNNQHHGERELGEDATNNTSNQVVNCIVFYVQN